MPNSTYSTPMIQDDADLIDELLDRWEEARQSGKSLSAEQLCESRVDLVDAVRQRIIALQKIDARLAQQTRQPDSTRPSRWIPGKQVQLDADFVDLEELAQGGLGVVCRGTDNQLHRDVAVKFMLPHQAMRPDLRERFIAEAEITGRLDHPGVVPVYGMGQAAEGQPFYVMRLIRGDTLQAAIEQLHSTNQPLDASQQRLRLTDLLYRFISVCKTIAYAHTRGIVHRDIKPQNIMLGKYGETLVVDWGLARPFQRDDRFRVLDEKTLLPKAAGLSPSESSTGEGTPSYMSPEQASGQGPISPHADVFSLGVTLYQLLTGQLPFSGKNPIEVRRSIVQGHFTLPRKIDHRIPRALEAICVKALANNPKHRYATALQMADDLSRYLADEPVSVYPESRLRRWTRRAAGRAGWFLVAAMLLTLASSGMLLAALLLHFFGS